MKLGLTHTEQYRKRAQDEEVRKKKCGKKYAVTKFALFPVDMYNGSYIWLESYLQWEELNHGVLSSSKRFTRVRERRCKINNK